MKAESSAQAREMDRISKQLHDLAMRHSYRFQRSSDGIAIITAPLVVDDTPGHSDFEAMQRQGRDAVRIYARIVINNPGCYPAGYVARAQETLAGLN